MKWTSEFDLKEGWEERVVNWYAEGKTDDEVIAEILKERGHFNQYIFNVWRRDVPEFNEAYEKGKILQKAWWINKGRSNLDQCKFNTPLYIRMMFNLFSWRMVEQKKDETPAIHTENLTTEELELFEKLMKKAQKQEKQDGNANSEKQLLKFQRTA